VAVLLAIRAAAPQAAEVVSLDVQRSGARLQVRSTMLIDAPQALVFRALSDYERFAELSARYRESRFAEPAADGTPRVYTRMEGCILFYCKSVARTARLYTDSPQTIRAEVEPEQSDFDYGLEIWLLTTVTTPAGDRTQVVYTHEFDPRFWVPPVLGVWAIKRSLTQDALKAATRIERLALSEPRD
jgi:uncharacterized protein YndB with AHSA1/START domain